MKLTKHPILAFIRMTILAEAWRSLRLPQYKDQALTAEEYTKANMLRFKTNLGPCEFPCQFVRRNHHQGSLIR